MRTLAPELLDTLPVDDPRAQRSRRDLRRVNAWMGNAGILAAALKTLGHIKHLVEIGAGDGTLALAVAHRVRLMAVTLVDRQPVVTEETLRQFDCPARVVIADVFTALEETRDAVVVANLFLHHFDEAELRQLFAQLSQRCRALVACEPVRTPLSLIGVRLLPLIGCNAVTRHDAIVSVRAGFTGQELTGLWPDKSPWQLREEPKRFASHLFVAQRR